MTDIERAEALMRYLDCADVFGHRDEIHRWFATLDTARDAVPEPSRPARTSRKTLTDLRNEAEARGITFWDDQWTKRDFLDEFARRDAALTSKPESGS